MKREDGTSTGNATPQFDTEGIEEIDLSDDKIPLHDALQKKQAEPAKAKDKPEEKPVKLSNLTCVICMDTPTDLTATACGENYSPLGSCFALLKSNQVISSAIPA